MGVVVPPPLPATVPAVRAPITRTTAAMPPSFRYEKRERICKSSLVSSLLLHEEETRAVRDHLRVAGPVDVDGLRARGAEAGQRQDAVGPLRVDGALVGERLDAVRDVDGHAHAGRVAGALKVVVGPVRHGIQANAARVRGCGCLPRDGGARRQRRDRGGGDNPKELPVRPTRAHLHFLPWMEMSNPRASAWRLDFLHDRAGRGTFCAAAGTPERHRPELRSRYFDGSGSAPEARALVPVLEPGGDPGEGPDDGYLGALTRR